MCGFTAEVCVCVSEVVSLAQDVRTAALERKAKTRNSPALNQSKR